MMGRSKVLLTRTLDAAVTITTSTVRFNIPILSESHIIGDFIKCEKVNNTIVVHYTKTTTPQPDIERDASLVAAYSVNFQ
jgi:hypothetical protein